MKKTQENCHAPGYTKYQKRVTIHGKTFWADPELIPLLKELNKVGLITRSHCSGHRKNPSWITIKMTNVEGVEIRNSKNYKELLLTWKKK